MIRLVAFILLILVLWSVVGSLLVGLVREKLTNSTDEVYKIAGLVLLALMFGLAISLVFPFFVIVVAIIVYFAFSDTKAKQISK